MGVDESGGGRVGRPLPGDLRPSCGAIAEASDVSTRLMDSIAISGGLTSY